MRFVAAPVLALMLAGCAGISKEECLYADWAAIGYEDGAAGRPVSAISSKRAACARKAGVTVDMAAYTAGRAEGLKLYCRPSNGYAVGANGGRYYGVCTDGGEHAFLDAYDAGRRLFSLEQDVVQIESDIRQAHIDLKNTERHITNTQAALIAPSTPMADRPRLLLELKDLSEDKGAIQTALIALTRDLADAERELSDYEDHLAFNGPLPHAAYGARNTSY